MTWQCKKCGTCCRIAGLAMPEFDRGDGACKMLTEDNLCSIYDNRPNICRVKKNLFSNKQLIEACDKVRQMEKEMMTYA